MKQDTKNTFAAILAAQQAAANAKSQPTPPPADRQPDTYTNLKDIEKAAQSGQIISISNLCDLIQDEKKAKQEPATPPVKMEYFKIIWQEGSGKHDGEMFNNWTDANEAMTEIYKEHEGEGYLKVKIQIRWKNGQEITDRADCSDHINDFCPKRGTIGEYLKKQNSVMYESNLMQGDRANLSFEDTPDNLNTTPPAPKDEPRTETPELSELTINDLLNDSHTPPQEPGQPEPSAKIQIIDYSPLSFAIIGETKPIKDTLKSLGGKFNMWLKCGAGWIFPKTKLTFVKNYLSI